MLIAKGAIIKIGEPNSFTQINYQTQAVTLNNEPAWYAHALFLELKKDGETLYPGPRAKKRFLSLDGKEYKNEHLQEQADVLFKLRKAGYAAEFAIGFDEAIKIIDEYLGDK